MPSERLLYKNVQPVWADGVGDEEEESLRGNSQESDLMDGGEEEELDYTSSEDEDEIPKEDNVEDQIDGDYVDQRISNVSFGALKQAQDTLSRKRKRDSDTAATNRGDKLNALRERLHESKAKRIAAAKESKPFRAEANIVSSRSNQAPETTDGDSETSDSDSAPSEEGASASKSRSSKHAPMTQSSKYQVSRKRIVVAVPKRVVRDPRFDALQQRSAHPGNSEKAYAFLRDYQESEIKELKSAIKTARNEEDKETLKRKVGSMQNRLKAKDAKEREQEIRRRHRKEEKARVEQGKQPFHLKRKEIKERALVEKFNGMKAKEREKLMEKRRRKDDQKEKKLMPRARRAEP